MFDQVCEELDVPFKRIGSMVLAFGQEDEKKLEVLLQQGLDTGIPDMHIITGDEARELEPHISKEVTGALLAKTAGIVSPYELAIGLAENAIDNGVECVLNAQVMDIKTLEEGYLVETTNGSFETKYVVNAAGVFADQISKMVGDESFKITPRKGHYYVLDKPAGELFNHVLFQCPSDKGKGILVTPTVHGNVLVGPDSDFVSDKNDLATEGERLSEVRDIASKTSVELPFGQVIRSFVGLRASSDLKDFVIGESEVAENFIHLAGFESPGLSSIPAVARDIVQIIKDKEPDLKVRESFISKRRPMVRFMELTPEEKTEVIKRDPGFGNMICRCEMITEAEIVDCIKRNAGATTLKGVKKRTRPGMGRCQGGFCGPRVIEILARELGTSMKDVKYDEQDAYIITEETKQVKH
jgi:glycerol-3-phosphate dehydrogenase